MTSLQDKSLWMANPKLKNWFDKTWLAEAKVMIISLCLHGLALLIVTWFDITDLIEELKKIGRASCRERV